MYEKFSNHTDSATVYRCGRSEARLLGKNGIVTYMGDSGDDVVTLYDSKGNVSEPQSGYYVVSAACACGKTFCLPIHNYLLNGHFNCPKCTVKFSYNVSCAARFGISTKMIDTRPEYKINDEEYDDDTDW